LGRGEGVLYYSWYKVFIPIVIVIGLAYVPFLWRLPRRDAGRFILAGGVFLGGAIGLEMAEAYLNYHEMGGQSLVQLIEETCEMAGVVLFIHALLCILADRGAD